jgi:threonyl-tRNA synthetase
MFKTMDVEGTEYQIRPMNCPFHCLIFKDRQRSYKELPIRWAELGTVYRYERSGTPHGLFRVRGFTQDDAHIFCLPSQLEDEIVGVLDLTQRILAKFSFSKFSVILSTRPTESVGEDSIWEKATVSLKNALIRKDWAYTIDEGRLTGRGIKECTFLQGGAMKSLFTFATFAAGRLYFFSCQRRWRFLRPQNRHKD